MLIIESVFLENLGSERFVVEFVLVFDSGISFTFGLKILDLFLDPMEDVPLMLYFLVDGIGKIVVLLRCINLGFGRSIGMLALSGVASLYLFQSLLY